jgi:hypothetical protein
VRGALLHVEQGLRAPRRVCHARRRGGLCARRRLARRATSSYSSSSSSILGVRARVRGVPTTATHRQMGAGGDGPRRCNLLRPRRGERGGRLRRGIMRRREAPPHLLVISRHERRVALDYGTPRARGAHSGNIRSRISSKPQNAEVQTNRHFQILTGVHADVHGGPALPDGAASSGGIIFTTDPRRGGVPWGEDGPRLPHESW